MGISKTVSASVLLSAASALVLGATAASAQSDSGGIAPIIVTAQRQAQSLQDVPIAVSAFSAESLEQQQINNTTQLQLSLPNVTFTKGNFTAASFTIRGIGDLCVGITCDAATSINMNSMPLAGTRIFETEFFDIERIEVLRGPQGTLYGRNATAGSINFISAKPDPSAFKASGEASYGNYNEVRLTGMVNLPLSSTLAVRAAGFYLRHDGYTQNVYNNKSMDGRDMYAFRGSLRWEPDDATTVDLMAYYFREDDDRLRIQKQMCQRDPTGVLGCLPAKRAYDYPNGNAMLGGTLPSKEFLTIATGSPLLGSMGITSIYGPDTFSGIVNPADPRKVNTAYQPTYLTDELQIQGQISHDFNNVNLKLSGMYQKNMVDSTQDYDLAVQNTSVYASGLQNMFALAGVLPPIQAVADALFPNGPGGEVCTSLLDHSGMGVYSGNSTCTDGIPSTYDRSAQYVKAWGGEAIVTTNFDGPLNFLVGGSYNDVKIRDADYMISAFTLDYPSGILGAASALGDPSLGNVALAPPVYWSNSDYYHLKSWGLFGEAYYQPTDQLKFTVGLRLNNDKKFIRARSTLLSFLAPMGIDNAFDSPYVGSFDADPGTPGNQLWQERNVKFQELTGRFVIDYQVTPDNLLYASYSRGYKSGGINPPLQPIFAVPETFDPEFVNAFEIGSKNRFADGKIQFNATAFYYQYKHLQLSRIIARTAVNDNVDANIYGVELEAIFNPVPQLVVNISGSYLHTKVSGDKYLADPFNPSGDRGDAVIVKDLSNASNCVVVPTTPGSPAVSQGFVSAVNSALGLQGPTPFPDDSGLTPGVTGAFGLCDALAGAAAAPGSGVQVVSPGLDVNIKGARLPQAPDFKVSLGAQWTQDIGNDMTLVPRFDMAFTGESYGNIFNNYRTRLESYLVMNAHVQLNGADSNWYLRAYVQNITNNSALTGLYMTDQSSANFTNIFTLEPRRYGITAGFKF